MEVPLLDLQHKATLQSLLSQDDLSCKQKEIVTILGGINNILNHYIASSDLDDERIAKIIAVIKEDTKLDLRAGDDTVNTLDAHQVALNPNESISRNIFSESISKRLTSLIRDKILMVLFLAAFFLEPVINSIEFAVYQGNGYSGVWALPIIIFLRFPMTFYLIALILCINVKALKLLSRTFLFWFKLLYFVQWVALQQIVDHFNNMQRGILDEILGITTVVMVIILVVSMDGLYLSIWSKRAILSVTLLYFAPSLAIYWVYGEEWYPNESLKIAGYELHVVERLRSVVQTLLIFVARQTIALWRNPTKSTVIGHPTYIRWNE